MKLQRCQAKEVNSVYDFNVASGQHGKGIYFFKAGNKPMAEYYSTNGENLYTVEIDNAYIKDLSNKNWDYWDAKAFIYNNPQYKGFIFRHKGHNIPTSKEILIIDEQYLNLLM